MRQFIVLTVASLIVPLSAGNALADETPVKGSPDASGVTVGSTVTSKTITPKEAEETRKYWTPERMRNAKPFPMPSLDRPPIPPPGSAPGARPNGEPGASQGSPGSSGSGSPGSSGSGSPRPGGAGGQLPQPKKLKKSRIDGKQKSEHDPQLDLPKTGGAGK